MDAGYGQEASVTITLRFNVQPGDRFEYRGTYTSRRGGKSTTTTVNSAEEIVAVTADTLHVVQSDDPDRLVTVYDGCGYPIDMLQDGRSIKEEVPGEAFDISNRMIFPQGPVDIGDTWEAKDGFVSVSYRLIGVGTLSGRDVAEIHATQSSYYGPIKHWVDLATGRIARTEYFVGGPNEGTSTVIERV